MSRLIVFTEGEYYHVFNRGVDKRVIFETNKDKERFMNLLYLCNSTKIVHLSILKENVGFKSCYNIELENPLVDIGAYCLMGNHFHLLLRESSPGGVSKFMQKLSTGYTMYFNIKRERTGSLFEGKFRARYASTDRYLKYLYSYIHLNPVQHIEPEWKKKGVHNTEKVYSYLQNFKFSSLNDYLKIDRSESVILNTAAFPQYFNQKDDFLKELNNWLSFKPEIELPY